MQTYTMGRGKTGRKGTKLDKDRESEEEDGSSFSKRGTTMARERVVSQSDPNLKRF